MTFRTIIFILSCFSACSVCSQPLGSWKDQLPYMKATAVRASGNKIITATPYALFTIDLADNSIERLSKVNGLAESGITAMEADPVNDIIIVAYTGSSIDLIKDKRIIHLDQLKTSNIAGDKTVSDIYVSASKAYLSTTFGIVLIDLQKQEIKENYIIGAAGTRVKVNQVAESEQYIYAATDEGLKRAPAVSVNLADYRNWLVVNGGWAGSIVDGVLSIGASVIAMVNDSLFINQQDAWKFLYAGSGPIASVNASEGKLVVTEADNGIGQVIILGIDGRVEKTYQQAGLTVSPVDAIVKNSQVWIADSTRGLLQTSGNSFNIYRPDSPYETATGEMVYDGTTLWAASGILSGNWENSFSGNGFFAYTDLEWKNYIPQQLPALDSLYDLVSIAVSRKDHSVWVGSLGGGLLQLKQDQTLQVFKQGTAISPSLFHPGQYRVAGLAFDSNENLWISNYGAAEPLLVKKADGTSRKFTPPFSLNNNALAQILVDDVNQKWIISPQGNGLLVMNHGTSIDNTGDDQWKLYRAGRGFGNLPDNQVLAIAKDRSGFIWVGTSKGIGIIQCPGEVFSGTSCDAVLPVVQQDNFAGYLFGNEEVQAITVNGADQKWIGTKHGAWLISSDGSKTIRHFTEENSPLPGNDVRKIAIDGKTGDVFFATTKGMCSFRDNAVEGGNTNEQVTIFPNPVPPGYNGSIAIGGLINNAIVKITELNGRLVFQTRALGGRAIWNGRNYPGKEIASGVYLVIVSDDSRQEKTVGKIVFISR